MENAIRGNSVYVVVDGPSWTQAEEFSVALGGHLITINNLSEYSWAQANIWVNPEIPLTHYFVGLNDATNEGEYTWISGEATEWSDITNLIFRQGWLAQQHAAPANDYFLVSSNDKGFTDWRSGNPLYTGEYGGLIWCDDTSSFYRNAGQSHYGIAEVAIDSSIRFATVPREGAGLFTTSISLSAGTEASGNLAEGATVYWKVSGITAEDLESGDLTGSGTITDGKLDIQHSLVQDEDTGESFEISVFSDESRTSEYQIGATASVAIEEGTPDPLTGILDLPGKVNLSSKGVTPFSLFGSDEIDVSKITLATLGFGLSTDNLVAASTKKNGSIRAAFEDLNQDGILDLSIKVDTSSLASILPKGTTQVNAFGEYADGTEVIFGMVAGDSVFFA